MKYLPALLLLLSAQAHAFSMIGEQEGVYSYLFADARSLAIEAGGNIDLGGLYSLSLMDTGIRVDARFALLPGAHPAEAFMAEGVHWQVNTGAAGSLSAQAGGSLVLNGRITGFDTIVFAVGNSLNLNPELYIELGNGTPVLHPLPGDRDVSIIRPVITRPVIIPAVPEPGMLTMLLAGGSLLALRRRYGRSF